MKIVYKPTVYLVGQQVTNEAEIARFLQDHDVEHWTTDAEEGGEKLCEIAGRLCYMSYAKPRPGGNSAYLEHIKETGHGSVLEHAIFNLLFTGVSRSLTHELVRHRAGVGYSQLSQRYVDESVAEYVCPPAYAAAVQLASSFITAVQNVKIPATAGNRYYNHYKSLNTSTNYSEEEFKDLYALGTLWLQGVEQAHTAYSKLIDHARTIWPEQPRKELRQAARSVLPNATETKISVTINARAFRHFLEMRASEYADTEIRNLAVAAYKAVLPVAQNLFGDYRLVTLADGTETLTTDYKKV